MAADRPDMGDGGGDINRNTFAPPQADSLLKELPNIKPTDHVSEGASKVLGALDSGFMTSKSWTPDAGVKAESKNLSSLSNVAKSPHFTRSA